MEKLLNVFANGLLIQYPKEDGRATKEANEEQKAAFVEALQRHLASASEHKELGSIITYDYYHGKILGGRRAQHENTVASPNGNLAEVIHQLPELPEGEVYVFPVPTFISFEIQEKRWKEAEFRPCRVCPWIYQQL